MKNKFKKLYQVITTLFITITMLSLPAYATVWNPVENVSNWLLQAILAIALCVVALNFVSFLKQRNVAGAISFFILAAVLLAFIIDPQLLILIGNKLIDIALQR